MRSVNATTPNPTEYAHAKQVTRVTGLGYYAILKLSASGLVRTIQTGASQLLFNVEDVQRHAEASKAKKSAAHREPQAATA